MRVICACLWGTRSLGDGAYFGRDLGCGYAHDLERGFERMVVEEEGMAVVVLVVGGVVAERGRSEVVAVASFLRVSWRGSELVFPRTLSIENSLRCRWWLVVEHYWVSV